MGNTSPTSGATRAEEILKKAEQHGVVHAFKKETIQELLKGDQARELLESACSRRNENEEINTIFPGFLGKESNDADLRKEWESNLEAELNEFYTAGVSTSENFIKALQDTRFRKHLIGLRIDSKKTKGYLEDLYSKFAMLYSYMLYSGNKDEQDSSLDFRKELIMKIENSETEDDDSITSLFGVDLMLLSFLRNVSMNEQEKALQRLYNTLYHKEPRKFDPSSPDFYVREDKLNQYMNCFILLLDSETTSEQVKELAIRLIILVANIRSSGEDYLVAYNYISSRKWKINLHAELSLNPYFKQIKIEEADDQPQPEPIKIKPDGNFSVIYEDSKRIEISNDIEHDVNWSTRCSFAFEEDYFYMFIRRKGIFKVGFRDSSHVKAGKIYKYRKLDIDDKCSLAFVNGVLYLRQAIEENRDKTKYIKPLEVIDRDTLDFIENEQIKERIRKTKRKVGIDDVNKPILEQSDPTLLQREIRNNAHNILRHVLESWIFTDGVKLYLPSYHFNISEGDEKLKFIEIESYNADTWEFISSIKLDFKPANVNRIKFIN